MIAYNMPSLGADMESGFLREWRVKPGDRIKKGDIIAEVETQKGIIEIEVFEEGIIGELLVKVDEQVPVNTPMATILTEEEAASGTKAISTPQQEQLKTITETAPPILTEPLTPPGVEHPPHHIRASPLAKKIAAEKGIDITAIHGTGPEGAIVKEDVEHAIAAQAAPAQAKKPTERPTQAVPEIPKEAVPQKPAPATEIKPVSATPESIRMAVAAAMSKSNRDIPHYYLETKIDMSKALAWLTETNKQRPVKERLLPAVLLIKAVAKAAADVPDLNAWWENGLQRKESINIGYVVALRTGGIMVPAIHDADTKTVEELMQALNDLIPRARAQRLRSSELSESTITITSLGEGGVETVFGVIYPPQVALVGFGGITEQPWTENGMLDVRPVLSATLAADHRATDGSTGSRFLAAVKNYLQQPDKL